MKTKLNTGLRTSRSIGAMLVLLGGIMGVSSLALAGPTPPPGTPLTATAQTIGELGFQGGTLEDSITADFLPPPLELGMTGGSFTELVYEEADGNFDFYFKFNLGTTTGPKPTDLENINLTLFSPYVTAAYYSTDTIDSVAAGTGSVTSLEADDQNGSVNFIWPAGGITDNGTTSTPWLVVSTNATAATPLSELSILTEGFQADGIGYGPSGAPGAVPEPMTLLFGFAIAGVIAAGAIRKLLAPASSFGGGFAA